MQKLRCGVIGVGHLGQHHARIYHELSQCELVGVHDIDRARMDEIAQTFETRTYDSPEELANDVDAISLAVPTKFHYELGRLVLMHDCHTLIEKPITETVEQANELVEIARQRHLVLYAGHTERFSPPLRSVRPWLSKPRYVEALRLAGFGSRGIDVSVIHDLMIHDIDLVLSIIDAPIANVEAIGVPVFTSSVDIANARLTFADGSIACLTASRVSMERVRKLRFFQQDAYISIDFLNNDAKIYRRKQSGGASPESVEMLDLIDAVKPSVPSHEPLMLEISDFVTSASGEKEPEVPGEAGLRALSVVTQIVDDIRRRLAGWS